MLSTKTSADHGVMKEKKGLRISSCCWWPSEVVARSRSPLQYGANRYGSLNPNDRVVRSVPLSYPTAIVRPVPNRSFSERLTPYVVTPPLLPKLPPTSVVQPSCVI